MRRDRASSLDAASPPGAALDAAYVDGAEELSAEERARVEARLAEQPEAQAEHAALRGLITRLRALPAEGNDPDWAAMERAIHEAVGPEVVGDRARGVGPWWRRWTLIAPMSAALTAALVLLVMWGRPAPRAPARDARAADLAIAVDQPARELEAPAPAEDAVALWLDGAVVDIDPAVAEALVVPGTDDSDLDEAGLLPSTDLAWVDRLDDDALARAERWLAGAGPGPGPGPGPGLGPGLGKKG